MRVNPEKAIPDYLLYAYLGPDFQEVIRQRTIHGSTVDRIPLVEFGSFPISVPPVDVQKEVVATLRSIDDRITILRETNATLESIAQALFKSWFVNFDPVRAKMEGRVLENMDEATAQLFPDSFEESELGLVPKGWRVLRLGDATERITKGTTPTTLKRPFVEVGINFVKAESMTGDGGFIPEKFAFIDAETHELLRRSQLQDGDVLISIAGTIGRIAVMTKDYLPANTNQAVALIRPLPNVFPGGLVNRYLRLSESQQSMGEKVVQAVQANLSLGTLSDLKVVVPPESVVVKLYESGLAQIDASWSGNNQRIRTLTSLRDTLLPRLISGQLRVSVISD
jgi:type I restriction enzyme S subunit